MSEPAEQRAAVETTADRPTRTLSRRRLWLFRLMAVGLPFALLLVLELAFRMLGVGQNLSLVIDIPGTPRRLTHQLNDSADLLYYGRTPLAGPEPRRFDLPKPRGTFRIVFLGASTVIGFPYPPELAFPRQVEVHLKRQDPSTQFEVLNVGIVSINSFAVAELAKQSLACDPDLIVVHSGHNEFYGPGGPASSVLSLPPWAIRATYLLRRLRLVQCLSSLTAGKPVEDDLLSILPRTMEIPFGGPVFHQAEANLRENLQRVVDICRQARVPVVLSTVASNIRDQSPMRAVWPAGAREDRRPEWEQLVDEAERQLDAGDADEALARLTKAQDIQRDHARLQFRLGQCLERLNRPDEARKAYEQARDLDACRFRAPSSFADIIHDIATRAARKSDSDRPPGHSALQTVVYFDTDAELRKVANPAGPGFELYLEHVHYNAAGHRQLGKSFAQCIHEQVRGKPWDESRVPTDQELAGILGSTTEDELAAYSFSMQVFQTAPLRGALDHARQDRFTSEEISRLYQALPSERRDAFGEVPMNVMSQDLILALAELHNARKNARLSYEFSRLAVIRRPWSPEAQLVFARASDRQGDVDTARNAVKTALELRPDWPPAKAFQAALPPP